MGHNCSGVKRTARLKRARRHEARLAKKYAASEGGVPSESNTLTGKKEEAVKK